MWKGLKVMRLTIMFKSPLYFALINYILSTFYKLCATIQIFVSGLPNMDSKDVEDLFKGVLTDEAQEPPDTVVPPEVVPNSEPANSFSMSHSNLNSSPAVVNNQQSGVIISQSPQPIVSPSHSG